MKKIMGAWALGKVDKFNKLSKDNIKDMKGDLVVHNSCEIRLLQSIVRDIRKEKITKSIPVTKVYDSGWNNGLMASIQTIQARIKKLKKK